MQPRPDHRFDPFAPGAEQWDSGQDFSGVDYSDPATMSKLLGMDVPSKTPAEVRQEAKQRANKIFGAYDTLQAILQHHEATIQNRWTKKKKHQKVEILNKAWPNMAKVHRPDFDAFKNESMAAASRSAENLKEWYMWPYINQEDLMKSKALLLLINSRGRNHPSEFAAADFESMHIGHITKKLVPVFLNTYTMILHGISDRSEYGKLLSWDDHPDAFEWMHTRKQFMPGEGLMILEAQEKIMEFLVSCCQQILHDIPAETLLSDDFPIQPEPHLKRDAESEGFESLASMAAESPYRVPAKIDFDQIVSLLQATKSAAEDHLWSLREDPGYIADQIAEDKEHRQEIIIDSDGNAHPTLKGARQDIFWSRVVGAMLSNAVLQFEVFSELRKQAQNLQSLYKKYGPKLTSKDDLPQDFLQAILRFRHYLSQAAKGPFDNLRRDFVASPPARKYFVRDAPPDAVTSKMCVRSKPHMRMSEPETEVAWLLRIMWEDGQQLFLLKLHNAMDELDRLIQTEPEAKEFLSPKVAGVIGNLSIISQCSHQLDRFLPWARSFENHLVDHDKEIKEEFARNTTPWAGIIQSLHDKKIINAAKLCDPSQKKFAYPTGKRRNKENTKIMRQSESNLDTFWAMIDNRLQADRGTWERTTTWRMLAQPRTIHRTVEWVDEKANRESNKSNHRDVADDIELIYKPMSNLFISHQDQGKPDGVSQKTKAKTKGQQSNNSLPEASNKEKEGPATPSLPPIPVDARALKVFRTLFYNPYMTSTPGEVSWTDFTYAMTSTGIFAAQKLYGSVWQFDRVDGIDQSRIQFHEPHPRGKIPFVIARRHGRRLNRAYGWKGEMFTLKKK